jgi:hypothetical protein
MERRDAFLANQAKASDYLDLFFAECETRLRGRIVSLIGHVPMLYSIALEAEKRGVRDLFHPRSFVMAGGGMKGQTLPDGWHETTDRFLGGAPLVEGYGMTEVVTGTRICLGGHYHLPAWHVPFLLDPASGTPLPRTGTRTGRYGTFDLNAQTYWGGFLTGDEVTLSWGDDAPCSCWPHRAVSAPRDPPLYRERGPRRQDHLRRRPRRARHCDRLPPQDDRGPRPAAPRSLFSCRRSHHVEFGGVEALLHAERIVQEIELVAQSCRLELIDDREAVELLDRLKAAFEDIADVGDIGLRQLALVRGSGGDASASIALRQIGQLFGTLAHIGLRSIAT